MQWSKIKQQVESRFAESLLGRVHFHNAGYRWHHEADGRIWITFDGEEVVDFCAHKYWNAFQKLSGERFHSRESIYRLMEKRGIFGRAEARDGLEAYLSLSIDDALTSTSPLLRGLALLDRRFGKRRLRGLELPDDEVDLVHQLLAVRLQAEGLVKSDRRLDLKAANPCKVTQISRQ